MIRIDFSSLLGRIDAWQDNAQSFFDSPELSTYITELVRENFRDIWDSEGDAIGEDWNGLTLVRSGNLRASWEEASVLPIPGGYRITTPVPYSSFVNDRYTFVALTEQTADELAEFVASNLLERQ